MTDFNSALVDAVTEVLEAEATVFCHPDDQWNVRAAFALMTPSERAQFELRITASVPAGQSYIARNELLKLPPLFSLGVLSPEAQTP